jgi:hypothetical protein
VIEVPRVQEHIDVAVEAEVEDLLMPAPRPSTSPE